MQLRRDAAEMVAGELYDLQLRAYSFQKMTAVLGGVVHDGDLERFWKVRGECSEIVSNSMHRILLEQ